MSGLFSGVSQCLWQKDEEPLNKSDFIIYTVNMFPRDVVCANTGLLWNKL